MARKQTCNECGAIKESNYMNDSLCKMCRSVANKIKRAKAREEKGLPPYGSGRSPYCSKCGKEKDKTHLTSGYCRECASQRRKDATTRKRLAQKLQPWGSGKRKLLCCHCNKVKENPNMGYCYQCTSLKDKEWRLRTGRTLRLRTGKCRCGQEIAPYSKCYCTDCMTIKRRDYLKRNPDVKRKLWQKAKERSERPDNKFKYHARQMVRNAIRCGMLTKQPCVKCGKIKVDAHHEDYTKPLDVIWLCRRHHAEIHKSGE